MILLFAGSNYYPNGGWEDFRGYFNSIDEAKKFIIVNWENLDIHNPAWMHLVKENKIILKGTIDNFISGNEHWEFESITFDK